MYATSVLNCSMFNYIWNLYFPAKYSINPTVFSWTAKLIQPDLKIQSLQHTVVDSIFMSRPFYWVFSALVHHSQGVHRLKWSNLNQDPNWVTMPRIPSPHTLPARGVMCLLVHLCNSHHVTLTCYADNAICTLK